MAPESVRFLHFYGPADSFPSLLLVTLGLHVFYPALMPALMPALDSACGVLVQHNELKDYGTSRQWGSAGFVSAGIILSVFTGMFGDQVILWALLLGTLIFVCLGFMHAPAVLSKRPETDRAKKEGMLSLFRVKHFGLVLAIVILLQAAHASYYNYGYLFLQEIHAPAYAIGIIINIAVIAEIIFFAIADRCFHQFSAGSLLAMAALGATVRWILVFAFPHVIIFCIAQTLHACSFAMGHYAFMKYLIKNISPAQIPESPRHVFRAGAQLEHSGIYHFRRFSIRNRT